MLTPCPACGQILRTEVGSIGAFRVVMFFEEEGSDTHTEPVERCPGCARWLHALAIKPSDIAPEHR